MRPIAHILTDFETKFGVPRQSGIIPSLMATIVFEPEFRVAESLRGLEGFDYLWIIWEFSEAVRDKWSPTVRPPRLGGNERMGVFATRSPFRPNAIGLSSVKIEKIEYSTPNGPIIIVSGADLMNNTPIFDIKPYVPYTDSHPKARSGFAPEPTNHLLEVVCEEEIKKRFPAHKWDALRDVLSHDPRPQYQHSEERIYGMTFSGKEVKFRVEEETIIRILDIQ